MRSLWKRFIQSIFGKSDPFQGEWLGWEVHEESIDCENGFCDLCNFDDSWCCEDWDCELCGEHDTFDE